MKKVVYLQPSQIQYLGNHSLPSTPSTNEDSGFDKESPTNNPSNSLKSFILQVDKDIINTDSHNIEDTTNPNLNLSYKSCNESKANKPDLTACKVKSWLTTSIEQLCSINIKRLDSNQLGIRPTNHLPNLEHNKFTMYRAQAPLHLQVVQKNGHWFAINGATLSILQRMEKCGSLKMVKAEVISLKLVPPNLFRDSSHSNKLTSNSYKNNINKTAAGLTFVRTFILDSINTNKKSKKNSTNVTQNKLNSLPNCITKGDGYTQRTGSASHNEETASKVSEEYCFDSLSDNTDHSTGASDGNDSESYESSDDEIDSWDDDGQQYNQGSSTEESEVYDYTYDEKRIKEYPCKVCHYRFRCQRDILRHQKDHKHFICLICDMILPTLKQYQAHKSVLNHWSDTDSQSVFDSVQEICQDKEHKHYLKQRKIAKKTKITV